MKTRKLWNFVFFFNWSWHVAKEFIIYNQTYSEKGRRKTTFILRFPDSRFSGKKRYFLPVLPFFDLLIYPYFVFLFKSFNRWVRISDREITLTYFNILDRSEIEECQSCTDPILSIQATQIYIFILYIHWKIDFSLFQSFHFPPFQNNKKMTLTKIKLSLVSRF